MFDPDSILFHQEHPIHIGKVQEGSRNRVFIQQKHPVIEVCIRSLRYLGQLDLEFVDMVLREHEKLCNFFLESLKISRNQLCYCSSKFISSNFRKNRSVIFSKVQELITTHSETGHI
ncbi:hypothetical protein D0469_18850 [Peribacillus saganii]|uniref:Uncharacterized protein n=1 Tax=Peribacillus saganii TaxID=2303992 RepID=A0A372LDZ9_9BACI|nr:hypothetical protein D0469_18850 [Peribacillus saganii]